MLISGIIGVILGILIGLIIRDANTVTLTDTYTPKPNRSANQRAHDDVLQLQDEIARSMVIKRQDVGDNKVKLTLKVVK